MHHKRMPRPQQRHRLRHQRQPAAPRTPPSPAPPRPPDSAAAPAHADASAPRSPAAPASPPSSPDDAPAPAESKTDAPAAPPPLPPACSLSESPAPPAHRPTRTVEVTARLPCFATFAPAAAATSAAAVEILKLPLKSPPVPHVSTSACPLLLASAAAVSPPPASPPQIPPAPPPSRPAPPAPPAAPPAPISDAIIHARTYSHQRRGFRTATASRALHNPPQSAAATYHEPIKHCDRSSRLRAICGQRSLQLMNSDITAHDNRPSALPTVTRIRYDGLSPIPAHRS